MRVQYVRRRVRDRPSDRHCRSDVVGARHPVAGRKHRVLRRPVPVDQHVRSRLQHTPRVDRRDDVAAREHVWNRPNRLEVGVDHLLKNIGGEPSHRDAMTTGDARQGSQRGLPVRHDDERRAVQQRAPDFKRGYVEGQGRRVQNSVGRCDSNEPVIDREASDAAMCDGDGLRLASRSRGVYQVGDVVAARFTGRPRSGRDLAASDRRRRFHPA